MNYFCAKLHIVMTRTQKEWLIFPIKLQNACFQLNASHDRKPFTCISIITCKAQCNVTISIHTKTTRDLSIECLKQCNISIHHLIWKAVIEVRCRNYGHLNVTSWIINFMITLVLILPWLPKSLKTMEYMNPLATKNGNNSENILCLCWCHVWSRLPG